MFCRKILKRAFLTVWKNKFLLVPGFFVSILGDGEHGILFKNLDLIREASLKLFDLRLEQFQELLVNLRLFVSQRPLFSLSILVLAIILFLTLLYLVIISQTFLIFSSYKINIGEKISLFEGFKMANIFFPRALLVNILAKGLIFLLLLVLALPFFLLFLKTKRDLFFNFSIFFSFVLLIPLSIVVSLICRFILCYLIIKGEKFFSSLKLGINLFLKNWLVSLKMALILFLISLLFGLLLLFSFFILFLPFVLLSVIFHYLVSLEFSFIFIAAGIICLMIVSLLFISFLSSFQYSSWVVLYLEIEKEIKDSKITSLF